MYVHNFFVHFFLKNDKNDIIFPSTFLKHIFYWIFIK
jgi:hypothetical protein